MLSIDTLLAWGATYKKLAPEELIFAEGTRAHFYYQLVSGSVRWVNISDEGKEFIQNIIEPGECFGELAMFESKDYVASAIASEASLVLRLPKERFVELLKSDPEINLDFSRLLVNRMRYKFLLVKELAMKEPAHQLVSLFSYFKENKKNISPECNRVELTRQQLADMTGMRVETVIRTIKRLQEKGFLVVNKGKVYC